MLVVRENSLPSFIPVSLDPMSFDPMSLDPAPAMPAGRALPACAIGAREFFVPRAPVRLPAARALSDAGALAQARAGVAAALDELRRVEAALESQLADMQAFLAGRADNGGGRRASPAPVARAA